MKLKTKLITLLSLIGLCSCSIKYDSNNLHTNTPKSDSPTETTKTDPATAETTATAAPETTATEAPVTTDATEPTTDPTESSDPSTEVEQKADLIVGYFAEKIDDTMIESLKIAFETYCSNNTLSISNVEYRAYSGKVAEYTTEIINSADLDVMIGTGKAKGNMTDEYLDSSTTIQVKGEERYVWTFKNFGTNTANRDHFLKFLTTTEATKVLSPSSGGDDETTPYITLGWWNYTTSGLTETIMSNLETAMDSYLKTESVSDTRIASIVVRAYTQSKVADLGSAINKDNDVDILLGVGGNITTKGGVETIEKKTGLTMGGQDSRVIARLTATDAAVKVYNWLLTDSTLAILNPTA